MVRINGDKERDMSCPHVEKFDIGLSEEGKTPCELCALITAMGEMVNETAREIKELEPLKAFARMKKEYSSLKKLHLKCAGCGLCFDSYHIAVPTKKVEGVGNVCQWCAKQIIDEGGLPKFLELLKQQGRAEKLENKRK
uniref:Uncharacterized protein n=1 Tax=viral metagenome TaxID=1070528 RepID=A0A6M3L8Z5_9ZZZZ